MCGFFFLKQNRKQKFTFVIQVAIKRGRLSNFTNGPNGPVCDPKFPETTLMLHAAYLSKFKAVCTDWTFILCKSRIKNNIPKKLFGFKITLSGREVRGGKTTQGNHSFIMGKVKNPLKISRQQHQEPEETGCAKASFACISGRSRNIYT